VATTYSTAADMLTGNIKVIDPTILDRYVQDATDEIDSKLGYRYVTPIVIPDTPQTRAGNLLLKRINNFLASGWFVLAQSISDEENQNNAYGLKLVQDATRLLDAIVAGTVPLVGAPLLIADDQGITGPLISNLDVASNVESFYNYVENPPFSNRLTPPIFPAGGAIIAFPGGFL
jgi:phage gp36-like protein